MRTFIPVSFICRASRSAWCATCGVLAALVLLGGTASASTLNVTSLADSGAGTLRQAVINAIAGDTIVIPAGVITLASQITISKSLIISGAGAASTTVAGSASTRIFNVFSSNSTPVVTIADLALINGTADPVTNLVGGAIYNTGSLTLQRVALRNNTAYDGGGAIYNISAVPGSGVLTLKSCELSGNSVSNFSGIGGGAIASSGSAGSSALLTIVNSTLANNTTSGGGGTASVGGAIYASRTSVRLFSSTIDGNHAGSVGANLGVGTVAGSSLLMRNSVIGDAQLDLAVDNADRDIYLPSGAAFTSQGYNVVQRRPAVAGLGATDAADGTAPGLSPLANNGGPTSTMKPAAASAALLFVPLASCVDENGSPLLADQRNFARRGIGTFACDAGAYETAFLMATAYSQKFHAGTPYRLALNSSVPISGPVSVEPRVIGGGHNIVFQFGSAVSSVGSVRAVDAAGAAIGVAGLPVIAGSEVSVNLTGIADQKRVSLSLLGVNGSFNTGVSLGFLVGDVLSNRTINNLQVSAEKARAGQSVNATNFIYDLNLSGRISAADIAAVKARNTRTLP